MNESKRAELLNSWSDRVRNARKQFFYEWLLGGNGKKSPRDILKHFLQDIQYLWIYLYYLLKHFKHYGSLIKEQYQVSLLRQFYQISYLVFQLRQPPKIYLKYHLFKPDVWKNAGRFTYSHYPIQQIVAKKMYPEELEILLNKRSFHQFCEANKISSPGILGYYDSGNLVAAEGDFEMPEEDIFVKEIEGQMGVGAKRFSYKDGIFKDIYGNANSKESIRNFIKDYSKRNSSLIIQRVVRNHESWLPFTSGALATCRVVTARNPRTNYVELLFSSLRMPVGNLDVDNYSRGGLVSAVNTDTGILDKAYCSVPIAGKFEHDTHPDTDQLVNGAKLPDWRDLKRFSLELHGFFSSPFIGWDVALTRDGCMVIEGSLYWNSGGFEAVNHLPFSKTNYPVYFEDWVGNKIDNRADYSDSNF